MLNEAEYRKDQIDLWPWTFSFDFLSLYFFVLSLKFLSGIAVLGKQIYLHGYRWKKKKKKEDIFK